MTFLPWTESAPEDARQKKVRIMWDTVETSRPGSVHLTHDLPCSRCGHAAHSYLACSDTCSCEPAALPGQVLVG